MVRPSVDPPPHGKSATVSRAGPNAPRAATGCCRLARSGRAARPEIHEPVDAAYEHRSADNIAERDRHEIAEYEAGPRQRSDVHALCGDEARIDVLEEQREWDEVHVRD